jgi:hypothetical protein
MTQRTVPPLHFTQIQQRAWKVGAGCLVACLLWAIFLNPAQFFHAYLMAYLFWLGIALGGLAIVMLHHLVGGTWGALIQRILEAATRTLPLMVLLFLPLLFGLRHLYSWAQPEVVASDVILQHKSAYLNVPFFILRAVFYFLVWSVLAYFLNRWSQQHERLHEQPVQLRVRRRLRRLSAPGLGIYALTLTFASIDWVMSLEPHWYSTLYGLVFLVGQVLSSLTFAIVVLALLLSIDPITRVATPDLFHDLGNLLLAFIMLWAYLSFSQFLIIWSGNLAEEIPWYLHRTRGGWDIMSVFLILLHFALPFVLLLSRGTKRQARSLARVAAVVLCLHLIDLFWLVMPARHPANLFIHWLDLVTPIGVGGLWLAVFIHHLTSRSLIPLEDRRLQGVAEHG